MMRYEMCWADNYKIMALMATFSTLQASAIIIIPNWIYEQWGDWEPYIINNNNNNSSGCVSSALQVDKKIEEHFSRNPLR